MTVEETEQRSSTTVAPTSTSGQSPEGDAGGRSQLDEQAQGDEVREGPVIAAPRAPWMVIVFILATFGVGAAFWLVGRARDIRALTTVKIWPWLWFLSPFFAISLIWSVPRIMGHYRELGRRFDLPAPRFVALVALVVFLSTATATFAERRYGEQAGWVWVVLIVVHASGFAWLQRYVNEVTKKLSGVRLRGRGNRYSWLEWVALVIGIPLFLVAAVYGAYSAWARVQSTPVSGTVALFSGAVHITMPLDGWRESPVDEAVAGFERQYIGPLPDQSVLVHRYDAGSKLDEVVAAWQQQSDIGAENCTQTKTFVRSTERVAVWWLCEERSIGGSHFQGFYFVEGSERVLVARGIMFTNPRDYARHRDGMIDALRSLRERQNQQ